MCWSRMVSCMVWQGELVVFFLLLGVSLGMFLYKRMLDGCVGSILVGFLLTSLWDARPSFPYGFVPPIPVPDVP